MIVRIPLSWRCIQIHCGFQDECFLTQQRKRVFIAGIEYEALCAKMSSVVWLSTKRAITAIFLQLSSYRAIENKPAEVTDEKQTL